MHARTHAHTHVCAHVHTHTHTLTRVHPPFISPLLPCTGQSSWLLTGGYALPPAAAAPRTDVWLLDLSCNGPAGSGSVAAVWMQLFPMNTPQVAVAVVMAVAAG